MAKTQRTTTSSVSCGQFCPAFYPISDICRPVAGRSKHKCKTYVYNSCLHPFSGEFALGNCPTITEMAPHWIYYCSLAASELVYWRRCFHNRMKWTYLELTALCTCSTAQSEEMTTATGQSEYGGHVAEAVFCCALQFRFRFKYKLLCPRGTHTCALAVANIAHAVYLLDVAKRSIPQG